MCFIFVQLTTLYYFSPDDENWKLKALETVVMCFYSQFSDGNFFQNVYGVYLDWYIC